MNEIYVPTEENKKVLAHIVIDPDAWIAHVMAHGNDKAIKAKVDTWQPVYEAEKAKLGDAYKNRAQREEQNI
jgi:hypothetical protein